MRDGVELVPNLTHIVSRDQKLYFYYEVYDPAAENGAPQLRTSLAFYRGKVKVFETPIVERTQVDAADRRAAVFQFEVPAGSLTPGSTPARSTSSTRWPDDSLFRGWRCTSDNGRYCPRTAQPRTSGAIGSRRITKPSDGDPGSVARTARMNGLPAASGRAATFAQNFNQTPSWRRYSSTFDT